MKTWSPWSVVGAVLLGVSLATTAQTGRKVARIGYLSAVSAVEAGHLGERGMARRVALSSVPFIAGFTVVFVLIGAGAAAVGGVVDSETREAIAGFVLVVLGLAFMGLLPAPTRIAAPGLLEGARRTGSAVLLGGAFAVCAAPCIGTVLASVVVLAGDADSVVRGGPQRRYCARHEVETDDGRTIVVGHLHASHHPESAEVEIERAASRQLNALFTVDECVALRVHKEVRTWSTPAPAIVDYAEQAAIDLIVMGTHGRGAAHRRVRRAARRPAGRPDPPVPDRIPVGRARPGVAADAAFARPRPDRAVPCPRRR